jgi:hypothetical protein
MDKQINNKAESYVSTFKSEIKAKIASMNINPDEANEFMEFIYEYPRLKFEKDDLNKRQRVKNAIPCDFRCSAKRANDEQCTRRRKEGSVFCGTHAKGTPNGLMNSDGQNANTEQHMEVFAQDICGIIYYIDNKYNVYKTEDVMLEKKNPGIIAKYVKNGNKYTIPELGLL